MAETFDPNFEFAFNCEEELDELIGDFRRKYDGIITAWQGGIGQTGDCYIDFHSDNAFDLGKSEYRYILFIAGKLSEYDDDAQRAQKDFAKSIQDFLREHNCQFIFTAYFSIAS